MQGSQTRIKAVNSAPQVAKGGWGEVVITLMTALLDQHPYSVRQDLFHNISFVLLKKQLGTNGICKTVEEDS